MGILVMAECGRGCVKTQFRRVLGGRFTLPLEAIVDPGWICWVGLVCDDALGALSHGLGQKQSPAVVSKRNDLAALAG